MAWRQANLSISLIVKGCAVSLRHSVSGPRMWRKVDRCASGKSFESVWESHLYVGLWITRRIVLSSVKPINLLIVVRGELRQ